MTTPEASTAQPQEALALLSTAQANLMEWDERWADYSGNNPDKFRTQLNNAREALKHAEQVCKACGALPHTPHEALEATLDATFPKAQSREVVEHQGQFYERRFAPASMSRSGKTVSSWIKGWVPLDASDPKIAKAGEKPVHPWRR